jgi:uncharacterized protein YjbI with pentapeptide repeats
MPRPRGPCVRLAIEMAKRTTSGPILRPRIPSSLEPWDGRVIEDRDVVEGRLLDSTAEVSSPVHGLDIFDSRLVGVRFTGADFTESVLRDVDLLDGEWSGTRFNESRFTRVAATGCRMSGFTASALKMDDVTFTSCRLDGASFRGAVGEQVAFVDCDLTDADFTQVRLTTCVFVRCDLSRAEFASASLKQVALQGCTLTDVRSVTSMSGVSVDIEHVLPLALAALTTLRIDVVEDDPLIATLLG